MLLDTITAAVLGFFLFRIGGALRHAARPPVRRHVAAIVSGVRWRHVWPVPFVLATVMLTATALLTIPGLDFGWWTAIGGLGNPVTGSTERTVGTVFEWLIPVVFLSLLLPVLPLFAEREERMFRAGAETQSAGRRTLRCLQFGLVHAVVGIPIGVALALSVGGAYFMWAYLRGYRRADTWPREAALLESTRAHLAYNGVIVVLVLGAIGLWLVTG